MDGGYDKALLTIIDAHVTTLITGVALFLFGTGPIKGFAVNKAKLDDALERNPILVTALNPVIG